MPSVLTTKSKVYLAPLIAPVRGRFTENLPRRLAKAHSGKFWEALAEPRRLGYDWKAPWIRV
jgi:hypothetical protein